jgi:hypothetical protein
MPHLSYTLTRLLLILSLSGSCYLLKASGQKNTVLSSKDGDPGILLEGRIHSKHKLLRGRYTVEVISHDAVTATYTVKHDQPVKLRLKKDETFLLRISKKGYVSTYICLNTHLPEDIQSVPLYRFSLEIGFIESATARRIDHEVLSMPMALVAYDQSSERFACNREYEQFINSRLNVEMAELALLDTAR